MISIRQSMSEFDFAAFFFSPSFLIRAAGNGDNQTENNENYLEYSFFSFSFN